ncbi:Uncharacterised protein [Mycobacteroides abscessus subsp. abscessus]|nr:Uncharacterised protein [Mycobacteroides abscessus subsp. abscessus]
MRADSATVARVWSRKVKASTPATEAARTAIGVNRPYRRRRTATTRAMARPPASSGPSAMSPWGATVAASRATTIASAAGERRRVAMARSTRIQVSTVPNTMMGSGRRPLLNGSQAVRKTSAAVQTAVRLAASCSPSRGSIFLRRMYQVPMPARVAGTRIHTPTVLTCVSQLKRVAYQSNGDAVAPK